MNAVTPSPIHWPIVGEQLIRDGFAPIQLTASEAKGLSRIGAITRTDEPGIWTITTDWDCDSVEDTLSDWAQEATEDRELRGIPYDTPSIANCDDAGTGEGQYHGRM